MISYTGRYIFGPKKLGLIVHFEYFDVFLAKMSGKNCYSNIFFISGCNVLFDWLNK